MANGPTQTNPSACIAAPSPRIQTRHPQTQSPIRNRWQPPMPSGGSIVIRRSRPMLLWILLPMLLLALSMPGFAQTPGTTPTPDVDEAPQRDQRCVDDDFATRCSALCAPWCRERAYFLAHQDFCLSEPVFVGTAEDSDPVCAMDTDASAGSLQLCLENTRRSGRSVTEKLKELEDAPEIVAGLKKFLEGVPDCAPDAPTLIRLFDCLKEEGGLISNEFGSLSERGYAKLVEFEKLCDIPRERMSADVKLARNLKGRAERLDREFESVNECKDDYENWANALSEDNAESAGGGLLQQWIEKTREDLKPAAETARNLDNQLNAINTQMSSILESIQYGLVLCP